jgi:hypothetical protein
MLQHLRAVSLYRSNFSDKQIFGTPIYSDVSCASVGDSVALDSCGQALDHLPQNDNIYSFKFQLETKTSNKPTTLATPSSALGPATWETVVSQFENSQSFHRRKMLLECELQGPAEW